MVTTRVFSCTTTMGKKPFDLLNVNIMVCIQEFIQGPHITTIQHQQLKTQLPPPYSDSAGSLISNMHFLLLRNLKRIWVSIAQPRPKGPNRFKVYA